MLADRLGRRAPRILPTDLLVTPAPAALIIAVAVPLARVVPALYRWRVRVARVPLVCAPEADRAAAGGEPRQASARRHAQTPRRHRARREPDPHAARLRGEPLFLPGARRGGPAAHHPAALQREGRRVARVGLRSPLRARIRAAARTQEASWQRRSGALRDHSITCRCALSRA